MFHVKQKKLKGQQKTPLARSLSLWMWGVKEKDMGGFRHYIKTPQAFRNKRGTPAPKALLSGG